MNKSNKNVKIPPPPINTPHAMTIQLLATALEKDNERLSTVLRCHLVLENVVEWALTKNLKNSEKLISLNYSKKIDVLEALFGDDIDERYYISCRNIGAIRNKLAHNLNEDAYKNTFFRVLNQELPSMPGKSMKEVLEIEDKVQDEIFIYKVIHTAQGIIEVSHSDEISEFNESMRQWLNTYPPKPQN